MKEKYLDILKGNILKYFYKLQNV